MKIEPGILKIYDLYQHHKCHLLDGRIKNKDKIDEINKKGCLKLLSNHDGGFCLDKVDFTLTGKESAIKEKKGKVLHDIRIDKVTNNTPLRFSAIKSFSVKWPYVTFGDFASNNYIFIINVFDSDKIHKVELPDSPDRICSTYITENNNLFIMTQKANDNDKKQNTCTYLLQYIDLDEAFDDKSHNENLKRREQRTGKIINYEVNKLIKYCSEDVGHQPFLAMHIRDSSHKDSVDNNHELIIYLLHDEKLYYWSQLYKKDDFIEEVEKKSIFTQTKPDEICETKSNEFMSERDGLFYILNNVESKCSVTGKPAISSQEIVKV